MRLSRSTVSLVISTGAAVADTIGGVLTGLPNFLSAPRVSGARRTSSTLAAFFSRAVDLAAKALPQVADIVDKPAGTVSTVARDQRRFDERQLQANVTAR